MMRLRVLVLFGILVGFCGCVRPSNPEAEAAAEEAARAWLAQVDSGQYNESWEAAASFLRGVVTVEDWSKMMDAGRKPLGEMKSREVKKTRFRTEMPGAPDGEYVIIEFRSSFSNKKTAVETVTPMKDSDGIWRVSGYYIK